MTTAKKATPKKAADEPRPRTGTESVNVNEPSPQTPVVERVIGVHGSPVEAPAKAETVDSIEVVIHPGQTFLVLNGHAFSLDTQTLLALRRDLDAASTAASY